MTSPRPLAAAAALLGLVLSAGCAPAILIPEEDRLLIERDLEGRTFYLRSSAHVLPFFSDPTRRLLSANPPDSIRLLNDTEGKPILPGEPLGLLPIGTQVRIERVEFPTSLAVTRRPLYSPRTQPWIYLTAAGQPATPALVIVLRQGIRTREELMGSLDQVLTLEDPEVWLTRYPPEVREAVRDKRLLAGMDSDAVSLAWGHPEEISVDFKDGARVETWSWPLGKRSAVLREGRLVSAVPALPGAAK